MRIKKILGIILTVVLCLALCACESSESSSNRRKDKDRDSSSSKNKDDDDGKGSTDDMPDLFDIFYKKDEVPTSDVKPGTTGEGNPSADDDSYGGSSDDDTYQGPTVDDSIDLSGLSSKHGKGYVYRQTGSESYYNGSWEYYDSEGYVYDSDTGAQMERTLTVYRFSDRTEIEYMLSSKGDWGEYWHVEHGYPAKCTYFDYVEGGTVTISGNQAIWESEYGDYREIYTLQETYEFTNN